MEVDQKELLATMNCSVPDLPAYEEVIATLHLEIAELVSPGR
mgnify:CR=1 FL=1